MHHDTPLIATIVVALTLAYCLGALAHRLRISPIAGYLLAGIAVGPHTPGFVADAGLAQELAEIGVILLMFGVGLHFSLKDMLAVRWIAIPGALGQMAVVTLLGLGLATLLGWPLGSGLVFGLALSVASTVVLLRTLQDRHLLNSDKGRIAVGWLIVEDVAMILVLVLLPAIAPLLVTAAPGNAAVDFGPDDMLMTAASTTGKLAAFVALMLVLGKRLIPRLLHHAAHSGSRELFRLCVLAIALGVAYGAAKLFGVSFALGAFFAGMILSESELSQRAAEETLPLRDAFAVLFFVSVGMLFNPAILVTATWPVAATLAIVVLGNATVAATIVLALRQSAATAVFIAASVAQIGEFSFILAGLGVSLSLLSDNARDLILAAALLSILANPILFAAAEQIVVALEARTATDGAGDGAVAPAPPEIATDQRDHVVLVGFGRVGQKVGAGLAAGGASVFVVDASDKNVRTAGAAGMKGIVGQAPASLAAANIENAAALVVAVPNVFEAGQIVIEARAANPQLAIVARSHSDAETAYLQECGATCVVVGAAEIANAMVLATLTGHASRPLTSSAASTAEPNSTGAASQQAS